MQRQTREPRTGWEETVQAQGLSFYLTDGWPYWDESACYVFSQAQIEALEEATIALDRMCLQAVEAIIERDLFEQFLIPPRFVPWVKNSWERDERTIYGRFDLAFDGTVPRLLEYNADTPTGLIEAAVIQWFWFKDVCGEDAAFDQFNSIHERLIEAWQAVKSHVAGTMYFTSVDDGYEDYMTASYLRDTAVQAGLPTEDLAINDIGWKNKRFVDRAEKPIANIFKLYPWEWLVREQFGPRLIEAPTRWLEAPWKMLLSNKSILPLLCEMFPESPYLLRADFDPLPGDYVKKPILAREGANASIVLNGEVVLETEGPYGATPFVYQQYHALPDFDGNYPVVGSWMVNGHACGIGIREDSQRITTNKSRFVPHLFHL